MTAPAANPVDAAGFTRPLIRALRTHVDQLAESIPTAGLCQEDLARRTRIAGAWVYMSALVAWAEDHQLVDVWLRDGLRGMPGRFTSEPTMMVRLAQAMAGLTVHPATQWVMHPRYNPDLHAGTPGEAAIRDLVDWWATDAPSLAYQVAAGPESITGWIVGDLLQAVTDDRRTGNALCQTPWWVADGILDRTLIPACETFRHDRLIRTVDPTAGTGHMLIRAMDYLWEWYTTGSLEPRQMRMSGATGGTVSGPADALTRLVASVDGVEFDPLTAAVARLRCTVYAAHLAHRAGLASGPPRLDRIPRNLTPRIGVGDSLLLGRVDRADYDRLHPTLADLPGASFSMGDWEWTDAAPERQAVVTGQLDLFEAAA